MQKSVSMVNIRWLPCPICQAESQIKLRHDTTLTNFPLFCHKCRQETLIDVRQFHAFVVASQKTATQDCLAYKNLFLSLSKRSVHIGEVKLNLTRQEFNLLYFLMLNKGNVLSHEQIYRLVWSEEYDGSAYNAIKNAIQRLRAKIAVADDASIVIENMRGVGYCLPQDEIC